MPEIKICEAIGACADLVVVRRLGGLDVSISTPRDGSASLHANSSNEVADGIAWFTESVAGIAGRATLRGVIDKLAPLTGPIETPEVALMERDREAVELRKAAMAYARAELGLDETWMGGGPRRGVDAPAGPAVVEHALSALTDQAERYVAAHLRCLDFAARLADPPPTNDEIRTEYHAAAEAVDNAAPGDRSAALDRTERAYNAWVRRGRP